MSISPVMVWTVMVLWLERTSRWPAVSQHRARGLLTLQLSWTLPVELWHTTTLGLSLTLSSSLSSSLSSPPVIVGVSNGQHFTVHGEGETLGSRERQTGVGAVSSDGLQLVTTSVDDLNPVVTSVAHDQVPTVVPHEGVGRRELTSSPSLVTNTSDYLKLG